MMPPTLEHVRSLKATGDAGLIAIKLADNADNSDPARGDLRAIFGSGMRKLDASRSVRISAENRGARVRVLPGSGDVEMVEGKSPEGTVVGRAIGAAGERLTIILDSGEAIWSL